jgi:CheY-like chemotaxis protein
MIASAGEEAVRIIPSLLWVAFAAVALALFYRPIRDEVVPRLTTLKLPGGIEVSLRERVTQAAEKQEVEVSEDDKSRIVRRLERSRSLLHGARILWVDDNPENNINEATILESFGSLIRFEKTTQEAINALAREQFDVVISDNERERQPKEGIRFVKEIEGRPWAILYVGDYSPDLGTPPYAFAITDEPHQLLHYVLDALERQRG